MKKFADGIYSIMEYNQIEYIEMEVEVS